MKLVNYLSGKGIYSVLLLSMLLLVFTGCGDDDDGGNPEPQYIVDVAIANGYNTLAAALTEANLVDDLQATGPFTVFAPTDAAFAAAGITADNVGDVENLEAILLYHVVSGEVMSSDLTTGDVATLNGATVAIDASALTVNGANISAPFDVEASNGVIHTIDQVLLPPPPSIVQIAQANSNLSILVEALTKFPDLVNLLNGDGSFTVFAPTNAAFADLLGVIGQNELDDIPEDVLKRVLQYHVIASAALASSDLSDGQMAATALGSDDEVTISISGSDVMVNNANVTTANIEANNGIIHVIDAVLVPSLETSIVNTIVEPAYFNKDFSILTAAVVKAELLETLIDGSANYTLFAPNNEAFEAAGITSLDGLDKATLTPILTYHVLGTENFASDLPSTAGGFATAIGTLNGDFYLTNNSNGVFINGNSQVVVATESGEALDYSNGVVHVINRTLLPEDSDDIVAIAQAAGFTDLAAALTEAGLVSALQSPEGPFTVFAPTNDAFQALYTALDVSGPADVDDTLLADILLYHVLSGRVFSSDLTDGLVATTLSDAQDPSDTNITINVGDDVSLTDYDPDVANPTVTSTDVLATNGVIHVIDAVLLPVDTAL
ncbi:fasciclin domain-containing protein [Fulvivirga ulvae]|uniref:fasciclin domain-containing protein n=1 Tax=Fulvivirga ulvae TaxID=2904245 RepID=UPI001F28CA92|nr:fasciclin domain-containing protein [Fulvivirga ulvae]UII34185.1 fasciclin domain-containing protein [Fulvivirga ulvae]